MKTSSRSRSVKHSPHRRLIARADELARSGRRVYNFTAGQPGLPPAEELIERFCSDLKARPFEMSKYIPTKGLPELRQAISEDLKRYGNLDVSPEGIVITSGGVEAMHLALAATTDPGDTVLLLDPTYSVYWDLVTFLGLKVRSCPQTVERGFQPDPECLQKAMDRDVRVVVLVSPDNPTSRIIGEDVAKLAVDLASEYDAWILYDEAYKHVVYEGQHLWLHRYPGALERLIGVNSFSKDIAIPGFRLGYLYAPREVVDEVVKLKGVMSIVSPVPAQWFAYYALTTDIKERYLRRVIPIYRSRRDGAYEAFRRYLPEARVWRPPAGMYLFPDLRPYLSRAGTSDLDFTYQLAEAKGVVVLPGSVFGPGGEGHVRFTFVTQPEEVIRAGVQLMAEFIEELERSRGGR